MSKKQTVQNIKYRAAIRHHEDLDKVAKVAQEEVWKTVTNMLKHPKVGGVCYSHPFFFIYPKGSGAISQGQRTLKDAIEDFYRVIKNG